MWNLNVSRKKLKNLREKLNNFAAGPSGRNCCAKSAFFCSCKLELFLRIFFCHIKNASVRKPGRNLAKKKLETFAREKLNISRLALVGGGRARKQGRVASVNTSASVAATKKGDLEVRKDLTIESQRAEIFFPTAETAAATTSRPSTSSVVTRAKVGGWS